jgi:SNF2 family DNA or RNA helicase
MWRADLSPRTIDKKVLFQWPKNGEVIIINPEMLPENVGWTVPSDMQCIVDEAHMFKNHKSKRSKALRNVAVSIHWHGNLWMLTGTPILTSPMDLWGLLSSSNLIADTYGKWETFFKTFNGYMDNYGPRFGPNPKQGALEPMRRYCIRRRKADVLPQLPVKRYQNYSVTVTVDEPVITEDQIVVKVEPHIMKWRADIAAAKAEKAKDFIEEISESEPIVVFSAHKAPLMLLKTGHDDWGMITGDTSVTERNNLVEAFKAGRLRVLLGTIGAMGTALTLTTSSHVVFIDRDWTPAMNKQAEDRVCRIGQTRGVIVTDIVSDQKVDKMVNRVLKAKQQLIENTVETL